MNKEIYPRVHVLKKQFTFLEISFKQYDLKIDFFCFFNNAKLLILNKRLLIIVSKLLFSKKQPEILSITKDANETITSFFLFLIFLYNLLHTHTHTQTNKQTNTLYV